MPHCPTFAAQEERLARFRFHSARRRGSVRVPGWRRARRGGRTGEFRQRRSGRPDPGLSEPGRRERVHFRPSFFCTPVSACRLNGLRSARGSRLGAMSPCSSTTLQRAASRRPAPSTSSQRCRTLMALSPIWPAFPMSTPPGSPRSGFPREATRRSRSRAAARPVSRRLPPSIPPAPTWTEPRSPSRR